MLIEEFGNTIKERRKMLGITQHHLAELADIHVNTIIRIEGGKINPSIDVINSITEILGMELRLEVKKNSE